MSAPDQRDPRDVEILWRVLGLVGGYLLIRWLDDCEERRALNKSLQNSNEAFRRVTTELTKDLKR